MLNSYSYDFRFVEKFKILRKRKNYNHRLSSFILLSFDFYPCQFLYKTGRYVYVL